MFANVSEISSYVVCPRICYYRMRFGSKSGDGIAMKEIYFSMRKGFGMDWARERFLEISDDEEVFESVRSRFVFDSDLSSLTPVDWEVKLRCERIRLVGVLDEIVEVDGRRYPLVLSTRSPKEGVWFRDRIKVTAFCMLLRSVGLDCSRGYVYHCFDGELRNVKIGRRDRYNVLRFVEKVIRLKKGFLPEGREGKFCERCEYRDACRSEPSTFASKFL